MSLHPKMIAACLAVGLALAACGDDETSATATDSSTTDSNATDSSTTDSSTADPSTSTDAGNGASAGDGSTDSSLPPPIGGGGGGQAIGTVEITVTHPEADPVSYTIGCLGDAFPVTPEVEGVSGEAACERLSDPAVLDRLVNGAPADQICTEIYGGPDVATIQGEVDGQAIDATVDRANGCGLSDWDDLLAGVLPPALGVT